MPEIPSGMRVYAIGDIHGRDDLLAVLLDAIHRDSRAAAPDTRSVIVFLGDYVDRGFGSKAVIDRLISEHLNSEHSRSEQATGLQARFVRGNHERTLLRFLSDPEAGYEWFGFGGAETLASYGVAVPPGHMDRGTLKALSEAFGEALPAAHLRFFESLETYVTIGDFVFVHAGLRPGVRLEDQAEEDCVWIRERFTQSRHRFEKVVVHGHSPDTQPFADARRIGLDTGAYMTGRLTAARFDGAALGLLTTQRGDDGTTIVREHVVGERCGRLDVGGH